MYLWKHNKQALILQRLLSSGPYATAQLVGDKSHPNILGTVSFYTLDSGVVVSFDFAGLPIVTGKCNGKVLGLHIHDGEACIGNEKDPFAGAGMHYNPGDCKHPFHAGDLPPVFVNGGYSWGAFYTERFLVTDVLGKTVILHSQPDDFTTQPSGNSGEKIACGVIRRN